jgi:hypothetical protein
MDKNIQRIWYKCSISTLPAGKKGKVSPGFTVYPSMYQYHTHCWHLSTVHRCSFSFREPNALWSLSSSGKWDHTKSGNIHCHHAPTHSCCKADEATEAVLLLGEVVYEQEDSNEGCHHGSHPATRFRLEDLPSKDLLRITIGKHSPCADVRIFTILNLSTVPERNPLEASMSLPCIAS